MRLSSWLLLSSHLPRDIPSLRRLSANQSDGQPTRRGGPRLPFVLSLFFGGCIHVSVLSVVGDAEERSGSCSRNRHNTNTEKIIV